MRRSILAIILVISPLPALAQQTGPAFPRFDIGIGAGGAVVPHGRRRPALVQGRVGVGTNGRWGVEGVVAVPDGRFDVDDFDLFYTIQGRYWLTSSPGKLQAAVTLGGSGEFERTRTSEFRRTRPDGVEQVFPARTYTSGLPPIAPTVGVAFQYALTPRVALRADAQAVLCPYFDAVGGMASAGVSIPIGRRAP
jgi:hypothetical protein